MVEFEEFAVETGPVRPVVPQRAHHFNLFIGAAAPAVERCTTRFDLLHPSHAHRQPKPTARQRIHRGRPLGQHDGMVVGQHQDAGGKAETLGLAGQKGK